MATKIKAAKLAPKSRVSKQIRAVSAPKEFPAPARGMRPLALPRTVKEREPEKAEKEESK